MIPHPAGLSITSYLGFSAAPSGRNHQSARTRFPWRDDSKQTCLQRTLPHVAGSRHLDVLGGQTRILSGPERERHSTAAPTGPNSMSQSQYSGNVSRGRTLSVWRRVASGPPSREKRWSSGRSPDLAPKGRLGLRKTAVKNSLTVNAAPHTIGAWFHASVM